MKSDKHKDVPARGFVAAAWALPVFFLLFNVAAIYFFADKEALNRDELQHAHIIWNIVQGKAIYRDFFEHHGPLFPVLSSLVFRALDYKPVFETFYALRFHNFLLMLSMLALTFALTRKLTDSRFWGVFSIAMLSSFFFFIDKVGEVRPDTLQNVFLLGSVYVFVSHLEDRASGYSKALLAGFLFGLATLCNSKAFVGCLGFLLFLVVDIAVEKKFLRSLRLGLLLLAGGLASYVGAYAYFGQYDYFADFLYYTIAFNMQELSIQPDVTDLYAQNFFRTEPLMWFILLLGMRGFFHVLRKQYLARFYDARLLFVLALALAHITLLFAQLWMQIFLSILPLVCITATVGFALYARERKLSMRKTLVAVSILGMIFFGNHLYSFPYAYATPSFMLANQKTYTDYIVEKTARSEPVFFLWNQCAGFVFNDDAQFFWNDANNMHIIYIRDSSREIYGSELVQRLEEKKVRYLVISGEYYYILPDATQAYIRENYTPVFPDCLLERKK